MYFIGMMILGMLIAGLIGSAVLFGASKYISADNEEDAIIKRRKKK